MRLLLLSALLAAPGQSPWFWVPPADGGALEVLGVPGGWTMEREPPARFQVSVPGDPRPKHTADRSWWEYYQEEQQGRQAALLQAVKARLPNEAPASWSLLPLLDWSTPEVPEADRKTATPREVAFLARYVEARAEAEAELEAADRARSRELLVWFNGRPERLHTTVNEPRHFRLEAEAGENRLEVMDPAIGAREVRTWWCEASSGPRLQVLSNDTQIRVMEPNGAWSNPSWTFRRATPAPGTYTVSWGGYQATYHDWWRPEEARPVQVEVDVLLNGGTDRERRFRFTRLCLPGGGEVVLGTFNVEN